MTNSGRGGRSLLLGVIALAVSSCNGLPGPAPSGHPDARSAGWTRVTRDGTFRSMEGLNSGQPPPHVVAVGVNDGKPLIAYIVDGKPTEIPFRSKGARGVGLRAITDDGMDYAVSAATDPESGEPAQLWHGSSEPPDDNIISPTDEIDSPRSTAGSKPVWLAPLFTDDDFGTIGVVREQDRWRVHGWLNTDEWAQVDGGSALYLGGTPSTDRLLTGMTEGSMLAAGDLSDGAEGADRTPQAWTLNPSYLPDETSRWTRHSLVPAPDGLTDMATWTMGWVLVGHKNLAPVAYDFDEGDGAAIDVPSTRLDPDRPGVFAALDVGASPILATQSADGPKVWFKSGGRWHDIPAPGGKLQGIKFVGDDFYLLVDGSIWIKPAPSELLSED